MLLTKNIVLTISVTIIKILVKSILKRQGKYILLNKIKKNLSTNNISPYIIHRVDALLCKEVIFINQINILQ